MKWVSYCIKNIFTEGELDENSVVRLYRTTAADGKSYNVQFFSLPLVLAVGYRVRSSRGTQFRQWATQTSQEYLIKGFVMDDKAKLEFERFADQRRRLKEAKGAKANIAALRTLLKKDQ
ncbi:hypothetical protein VIM7927_04029 [Vibrio mangrovi]|uniref:RhuM family protein n=1 Tax=Vibrio mangrovi TaxID=474394 RepID=A0A1Y6IYF2_9VIBR|nr:RhuM family protein [Vibrio mangrovi]MDW6002408.1 RhuM family protein [Vibrio mangrovi]SMS02694.1 hypothetical protein VIM7927_04029 [Vibrio mangrovi]